MQIQPLVKKDNEIYPMASIVLNAFHQLGANILQEKHIVNIYREIRQVLLYQGMFQEEIEKYLMYGLKLDDDGDMLTILPQNIICALWFANIYPDDLDHASETNEYFDGEDYSSTWVFNPKNFTLKKRKIV